MCFERRYNAEHLSKHPNRLITSMTLALDPDGPVARGSPTMEEGKVSRACEIVRQSWGVRAAYKASNAASLCAPSKRLKTLASRLGLLPKELRLASAIRI
jgi:hypothetical protein